MGNVRWTTKSKSDGLSKIQTTSRARLRSGQMESDLCAWVGGAVWGLGLDMDAGHGLDMGVGGESGGVRRVKSYQKFTESIYSLRKRQYLRCLRRVDNPRRWFSGGFWGRWGMGGFGVPCGRAGAGGTGGGGTFMRGEENGDGLW